jgi:S1-C subfamily serine protease
MAVAGGGPAEDAGIAEADTLLALAGEPVGGIDDLHRLLTAERIGEALAVTLWRRGRTLALTVRPSEARPR